MKTLHIVRKINDPLAYAVIADEMSDRRVVVLLMQDGVLSAGHFPEETYVCEEDLGVRGGESPYFLINYPGIVRLIRECDRVTVW